MAVAFSLTAQLSSGQPPWGDGPPPWANREGGSREEDGRRDGGGRESGWRGGRGGGFDPVKMLQQFDTNGNQMIDMDEMQGPARFMLDRMARDNPSIDLTKPVPFSKITEAMESRMRGGGGGDPLEESDSAPTQEKPLVPDFGAKAAPEPLPGFGKDGDKFAVKAEERDFKEASDRISRYDKNKDEQLDEEELKEGRWSDNPMQYDRNRDKKLNKQELAVRYARKRLNSDNISKPKELTVATNSGQQKDTGEKPETVDPWKAQAHYRITPKVGKSAKVQGVQGWFTSSDTDGDGQVMMHEFASNWDDATIEEFDRFDANHDGTITTIELLKSVKDGVMRGSAVATAASDPSDTSVSSRTNTPSTGQFDSTGVKADWISFCEKKMKELDSDKNYRITSDEWPASNGEFNTTDTDQDGMISMAEYYKMRKESKKK